MNDTFSTAMRLTLSSFCDSSPNQKMHLRHISLGVSDLRIISVQGSLLVIVHQCSFSPLILLHGESNISSSCYHRHLQCTHKKITLHYCVYSLHEEEHPIALHSSRSTTIIARTVSVGIIHYHIGGHFLKTDLLIVLQRME